MKWQPWFTPAIVVTVGIAVVTYWETRLASVDRRFDTLGTEIAGQRDRTDRVLEAIADGRADIATLRGELATVAGKVERVAQKLQVSDAGSLPTTPAAQVDPNDPLPANDQPGESNWEKAFDKDGLER